VKLLNLLLLIVFCINTVAQSNFTHKDSSSAGIDTAISYYHKFTNQRSRLYNGKEFIQYHPDITGHAFFENNQLNQGFIIYDGLLFENVNMQYDLVKDEVVIQHFDVFFKLVLISEKVSEFNLLGHHYKRLVKDPTNKLPGATGFYDFLHEGKITLIVKRTKRIEETVTDKINRKVTAKDFFYIISDGTWRPVNSQKSLLAVFGNRAKEVRQAMRKSGLKYRRNREASITRAVKFYDASNN
jgi:hypothetical protein